jgi:hypothetical protein
MGGRGANVGGIMPEFDYEKLLEKLKEIINLPAIKKELNDVKLVGFDDPAVFLAETSDVGAVICGKIGEVARELDINLDNEGFRKAVIEFLDDLIKLPIWAEPFDGIIISLIINKIFDWLGKIGLPETA